MAFSNLASNQGVSGSNLQNAVDTGVISLNYQQTIDRTSQLVTNSYVAAKTNSVGSAKAANQLLTKGDIYSAGSQRIIIGSYDAKQFPSSQSLQYTAYDSSWTVAYPSAQWQHLAASPNGRSWLGSYESNFAWGDITANSLNSSSVSYSGFVAGLGLSDSGTYLYAIDGGIGGSLYVSQNGGANFTNPISSGSGFYYTAMACSGSGAIVVLFKQANDIYSTGSYLYYNGSYGTGTWEYSVPTFLNYTTANACAVSYTGQYSVVACGDTYNGNNKIWINNNGFAYNYWTGTSIGYVPDLADMSGDGRCIIVGKYGNAVVYTSTNYGVSWSTSTPRTGSYGVAGVSVSQNGGLFAIIGGEGSAGDSFCVSANGTSWATAYHPTAYVYDYGTSLWSVIAQ